MILLSLLLAFSPPQPAVMPPRVTLVQEHEGESWPGTRRSPRDPRLAATRSTPRFREREARRLS